MASTGSHAEVGSRIGIVGGGILGLLALKNLKEQGLEPTLLEQNEFIGGAWHYTPRTDQTSALPMTSLNTSSQSCHFTDFPFPKGSATHPHSGQVETYIEAYAREFDLLRHVQFSTKVARIKRDDANGKWNVYSVNTKAGVEDAGEKCQTFDRVVVATGMLTKPVEVKLRGIDKFEGETIHSQKFKDPSKYENKNVLVVGIGATGADAQSFLRKSKARSVYLSHRGQYYLMPKMVEGKAFDHSMTRRALTIIRGLGDLWPKACAVIFKMALISARRKAWPWLDKHPSFMAPRVLDGIEHRIPIVSQDLPDNLRDGSTKAVAGIREISGPKSVTLTDGTVLEDIDAIIICSGYHYDFSLVEGAGNPTNPDNAPDRYQRIDAAKYKNPHDAFPRLYRGVYSEQYPESLAFLGHFLVMKPPFVLYDLVSMALASVWSGNAPFPTDKEIKQDIDHHYDVVVDTLKRGNMPHMGARMFGSDTYNWLNETAGTGVTERLGCFSREAWKLWWNERKFYNMLMDGVDSPAVYRLFDTGRGRKPWPGAREHIIKNNEVVKEMGEKWKREQKKTE